MKLEISANLKERYKHIHPLVFFRSIEKSNTIGELFDILETLPNYPIVWSEKKKCWLNTKDILQVDKLKRIK